MIHINRQFATVLKIIPNVFYKVECILLTEVHELGGDKIKPYSNCRKKCDL